MSIRLKDTIYNKSSDSDKLDGSDSSVFVKTVKVGDSPYDANSSIISLPAYPTIPTTLPNPKTLSWSGYNTGSYSGSTAASFVIPNNTNQLTNGAGFITASSIPTTLPNPKSFSWSGYSSGSYDGSTAKSITIPNNTDQLENGAGFITSSSIPTSLPNPQKLTITVNGTKTEYDGSSAKSLTLTIPSSITNYVTTDTDQSISGTKTFSKTVFIKNIVGLWIQKSEADNSNANSVPYIRFGKYTSNNTASNDTINGELGVNDSKELVFYKGTSGDSWNKVWHSGNFNPENYLPLSGGTLTNSGSALLTLVSDTHNYVDIKYVSKNATTTWCAGADYLNTFYFWNNTLNKDVIKINNQGEMKFIGASDDSRYTISYYGGVKLYGATGGWAMGIETYKNDGTHMGGVCGAYGSNGGFDYWYYGGYYNASALYIKDGKVGIGTNSPETKFHIKGGNMFLYSSSTPYIAFKNDDGSSYYCDIGAYNGVASVWHNNRGWETILTSGNWSNYITSSGGGGAYLPLTGGSMTGTIDSGGCQNAKAAIKFRNQDSWHCGISYDTDGNECLLLWAQNTVTRFRWHAGTNYTTFANGNLMNITPDFEISKASGSATGYIAGNTILTSKGGTLNAGARIGHAGTGIYLGNSANDGWIYTQDIRSQDGHWAIYTNGNAHFVNLFLGGEQVTFVT